MLITVYREKKWGRVIMQQEIIVEDRVAQGSTWHEESTGKCEKASEARAEKLERWGKKRPE